MLIFDMLNRSINLLNVPKVSKLSNFKLYLQSDVQKAFRRPGFNLSLRLQSILHCILLVHQSQANLPNPSFFRKIEAFQAIFGDFRRSQLFFIVDESSLHFLRLISSATFDKMMT